MIAKSTTNNTTCPTCGARMKSRGILRLDDIPGNEYVKRAIEVALVGDHTIGLSGWCADEFGKWVAQQEQQAFVTQPCRCGNYGSARFECLCTVRQVQSWRKTGYYQRALHADIWIKPTAPSADKLNDTHREKDEDILERVRAARMRPAIEPKLEDEIALRLQRAWLSQIGRPELMPRILQVAATIAQMSSLYASVTTIRSEHLAEAMQYIPSENDR
jgi:predicted ATPase with chaperone activity